MQWENLTYTDFKKAVKISKGVCLLPLAVIEKHGNHLPLGTDMDSVYKVACLAAEKEPAVVFPRYYFTQILEAKHQPGTIAIEPKLMLDLLENVCDEIGRNGFKKIILLNGHGGNPPFLQFFVGSTMLNKKKPYIVYLPGNYYSAWGKFKHIFDTDDCHGGEVETSFMMAINEKLVKKKYLTKKPGFPLERLKHLGNISTPISWYANYPDHYAGNAKTANRIKGEKILKASVEYVTEAIKTVKKDTVTQKLYSRFFKSTKHS